MQINNVELDKFENTNVESIIKKISNGQWQEIYNGICTIQNQSIKIDYIYFKYLANKETYQTIFSIITKNIDIILSTNNKFYVYINMKYLTISELEKHMDFIQNISKSLRDKYPDKLLKCFIINAPFVFSQLFNILSFLIDKDTLSKIEIITNK